MNTTKTRTLAVIGRGLIGSAAARHLSNLGHQVVLIGPEEPADYAQHDGVFGSHFDEGRITRRLDLEPFWRDANIASLSRYHEIADQSGVAFHSPVGVLHMGPAEETSLDAIRTISTTEGIRVGAYIGEQLAGQFPYLNGTGAARGYFESEDAGYINPRRLVSAQTTAARRSGALVIDDTALAISETSQNVTIRTKSAEYTVDRVLVAAGGHTRDLIGQVAPCQVYGRTVALFRLGPGQLQRLRDMPAILVYGPRGDSPYILPPITYPDGNAWLKLGGDPIDTALESQADISRWFRSGGSLEVADLLTQQILQRIDGFTYEERVVVPCMTTFGQTGLPTIGPVSERVSVAFCCYGKSAKCSDELGRLGGLALLGEVSPELAP